MAAASAGAGSVSAANAAAPAAIRERRKTLCPLVLSLMSPSLASRSPFYLVAVIVYERSRQPNAARFSKKVSQLTEDDRFSDGSRLRTHKLRQVRPLRGPL